MDPSNINNDLDFEQAIAAEESRLLAGEKQDTPNENTPSDVEPENNTTTETEQTENTEEVEQTEPTNEPTETEPTPNIEIEVGGNKVRLDSVDELVTLAQKGMENANVPKANISDEVMLQAMQANGISKEDLNLLIDMKKGKQKEVLQHLAKQNKIDPLDFDEDSNYSPENHIASEEQYRVNKVLAPIKDLPETQEVVTKLTEQSANTIQKVQQHPEVVAELVKHKQAGIFDVVNNEINKLKALGKLQQDAEYIDSYHAVYSHLQKQHQAQQAHAEPEVPKHIDPNATIKSRDERAALLSGTKSSQLENNQQNVISYDTDFTKDTKLRDAFLKEEGIADVFDF